MVSSGLNLQKFKCDLLSWLQKQAGLSLSEGMYTLVKTLINSWDFSVPITQGTKADEQTLGVVFSGDSFHHMLRAGRSDLSLLPVMWDTNESYLVR
jgi:hypothetical protein